MTTVPDSVTPPDATVTVDRPEPLGPSDVVRIDVKDADGLFWDGSSETGPAAPVRAGKRYLLRGRCLPATAGGTLVVDLLGPGTGGAAGAPSQPMSGPPVATITVPCDGTEVRLDLGRVPTGSGELMVSEATTQVASGWVLLTRVA